MAELADAIDLGSIVNRRAGSSPVIRTKKESEGLYDLRFLFRTHSVLEPAVQGLRFAPVGAEQTSSGRLAPHLPLLRRRRKVRA